MFGFFVVPPEETFADDEAAQVVFDEDGARIYRVTGPLDPAACRNR